MAEQVSDERECRELDAWLAEHLFGLGPLRWFDDIGYDSEVAGDARGSGTNRAACFAWPVGSDADPAKPYEWEVAPRYSTTGDGMVAVFDALIARDLWPRLTHYGPGRLPSWEVDVRGTEGLAEYGSGKTAPLAVARAAKAALEGDVR